MLDYYPGTLILVELPGISGQPMRDYVKLKTTPFPRADEIADSFARAKDRVGVPLDAVGHSYGGGILMYLKKYRPDVIDRTVLLEASVFFYNVTCWVPLLHRRVSLYESLRNCMRGQVIPGLRALLLSEPWQQHVIRATGHWYELCHWGKEQSGDDIDTLVVLAEKDDLVDPGTEKWLAREHPEMTVLTHAWPHGGILLPWKVHWTVNSIVQFLECKTRQTLNGDALGKRSMEPSPIADCSIKQSPSAESTPSSPAFTDSTLSISELTSASKGENQAIDQKNLHDDEKSEYIEGGITAVAEQFLGFPQSMPATSMSPVGGAQTHYFTSTPTYPIWSQTDRNMTGSQMFMYPPASYYSYAGYALPGLPQPQGLNLVHGSPGPLSQPYSVATTIVETPKSRKSGPQAKWPSVSEIAADPVSPAEHTRTQNQLSILDATKTTVGVMSIPNNMSREQFIDFLDSQGCDGYDFVYVPHDFHRCNGLGYSFVNFARHDDALKAWKRLNGFNDWKQIGFASKKTCKVCWGEPEKQGRQVLIELFKNSPVMHKETPEQFQPVLFKDGGREPFPPPTRKLKRIHPAHGNLRRQSTSSR